MFISTTERIQLRKDVDSMSKLFDAMNTDMVYLIGRIKALEGKKKPVKKKLTEAQRAKQREYAKRYKAKKQLEKQNATSISPTSI